MKSRKVLIVSVLSVILLGSLIFLRWDSQTMSSYKPEAARTFTVGVSEVTHGTMSDRINVSGDVEGIHEAEVISETGGKVVAIAADIDNYLEAGGSIARVESDLQEISLEQAIAQTAAVQASSDKADLDLRRIESLFAQKAVSESQRENAELAAKAALAQLRGAQAAEKLARKRFDDTVLRTPIAGRLAQKFITVGKMINPGMKVATVVDDRRLKLEVGVPEEYVASVRPGDDAEISSDVVPGISFRGVVKNVALKADPATRTFQVEIEFTNDESRSVKSGMFVRAVIVTSVKERTLIIPAGALLESIGSGYEVYVANRSRAYLRKVKIGIRTDSLVEVTQGLVAGDTVVTFGQQSLRDGAVISYRTPD